MKEPTTLYMFAIMPPADLSAKIHNERLNFAEAYHFTKALKPPVHITLHEPFKINSAEAADFEKRIATLQKWTDKLHPFPIELHDYNYFEHSDHPVIYIDVVKSTQLNNLKIAFTKEFKKYLETEKKKSQPYRPHIAIGYRDATLQAFRAIKAEYSKKWFRKNFDCNSIFLWKHNGTNWQIAQEYHFKGIEEQIALF